MTGRMHQQPQWFSSLLGSELPGEGETFTANGVTMVVRAGIPRAVETLSESQDQTSDTFGFKWQKRDTFENGVSSFLANWLVEKYGDITQWDLFKSEPGDGPLPIVLDAGCGAGVSGLAFFAPVFDRINYLGADVSVAVDTAAARASERGADAAIVQADLMKLPLPPDCVDFVFSEGVLHHTDDTQRALAAVTRHLKPGGHILFYVYRRKGPIREFTDDYIRDKLKPLSPEQGWEAMMPLTKLGQALGQLDVEIDVPERIDLLDIPAGPINLQRLVYWHVFKAFYRQDMTLDEMNHINFDWYAPVNAHRQSIEEVRDWCAGLSLSIEREVVEDAGITIIAKKMS